MTTDLTWDEFCELYFDLARNYADYHLVGLRKKNGAFDKRIDLDYVKDAAVLYALEKAFAHYDAQKGAKVTTFLSRLVHNEIVDELARESKKAGRQEDIDDLKKAVRACADDDSPASLEKLIPRLRAAIEKLSPSDQVILDYYLEDKSSYIARSVETLHVSENYVSVRRYHILKSLPKLMEMTRSDYLRTCYDLNSPVFADTIFESAITVRTIRPNPILPTLDINRMAGLLAAHRDSFKRQTPDK